MQPQIVGIENSSAFIRRYKNLEKIEVFAKVSDKTPFCVFDSEIEADPVDAFCEFMETQDANGNGHTIYYVRLSLPASGKKDNTIGFTFAAEAKKAEPRPSISGGPSPAFEKINELYLELGKLRTENEQLKNDVSTLENEINELENAEPEISGPVDPLEKIRPYVELAKELQPLINGFFNRQPIAVNGPGQTDINSLLSEMQILDKNFSQNFEKLVILARTKPEVYAMAIQYLNQL